MKIADVEPANLQRFHGAAGAIFFGAYGSRSVRPIYL